MGSEIFGEIGNRIDVIDVYERYTGNTVNRRAKKALCPFHNDHRPSLHFKNNKFKCFACGKGGNSINLTSDLFNLSILDAAKKLSADYNLNLFEEKSSLKFRRKSQKEIAKQNEKQAKEQFNIMFLKAWRESRYRILLEIFRTFREISKIPKSPEDKGAEIFAFAQSELQNMTDPKRKNYKWSMIEEKLELLETATDFQILKEYKNIDFYIANLENRWNKTIQGDF